MDPITHLLIGSGVAGAAGGSISLANPTQIGALIGSLTPDFDIILQLKGDMFYLKHHRGFSHSLLGIGLFTVLTAIGLKLFFPLSDIWQIMLWTFLGNLSHILIDLFNSYGAKIFWPLSKKMFTFNLLMIFDPVIIILFGAGLLIKGFDASVMAAASFGLTGAYLIFRFLLRRQCEKYLARKFRRREVKQITVMPSLYSLLGWDFLIETPQEFMVGQVRNFSWRTGLRCRLAKEKENKFFEKAIRSKIGMIFGEFTPHYHVSHWREGDKHVIKFTDLRYFMKKDFMHSATLILDNKLEIIEEIFHPYNKNRNIILEARE